MLQRKGLAAARFLEDGAIVGARIALAEEEGANARLLQDVAELVRAIGGVDIDQHHPRAGGSVLHENPLDAVAGPNARAVAGRQSETRQAARHARGFAVEFTPGEARILMAHHQGFAVGESGCGVG